VVAVSAGHLLPGHGKAGPFDDQFFAVWAVSVFSGIVGDIADIDIMQPLVQTDFSGADYRGMRGGGAVVHLVGGPEPADVPGDVGGNTFDETGDVGEFLVRIVPARNHQGGDLHPDPQFLHQPDRVEDRLQPGAADLFVEFVGKGLEVYIVGIKIRSQFPVGFRPGVAVADKDILQACRLGQPGGIKGEFIEDGGLHIGIADGLTPGSMRGFDHFRRGAQGAGDIRMKVGILGDLVILAVFAVEIAAHRGNGIGKGAGQQMEDGLLFDGVDIFADQATVVETVENSPSIFPDSANSPVAFTDQAMVATEQTADMTRVIGRLNVKKRFMHGHPSRRRAFIFGLGVMGKGSMLY